MDSVRIKSKSYQVFPDPSTPNVQVKWLSTSSPIRTCRKVTDINNCLLSHNSFVTCWLNNAFRHPRPIYHNIWVNSCHRPHLLCLINNYDLYNCCMSILVCTVLYWRLTFCNIFKLIADNHLQSFIIMTKTVGNRCVVHIRKFVI